MKRHVCLLIALCLDVVPKTAAAQPPPAQTVQLNLCEKLTEDILMPAVYRGEKHCRIPKKWRKKLAFCATIRNAGEWRVLGGSGNM